MIEYEQSQSPHTELNVPVKGRLLESSSKDFIVTGFHCITQVGLELRDLQAFESSVLGLKVFTINARL